VRRLVRVSSSCLACGEAVGFDRVWSGTVGPFCDSKCRDTNEDRDVWKRANLYAERVASDVLEVDGATLEVVDVARAFVIGYAAGLEAASSRRTVRK
jgi:hypothetical protein